MTRLFLIRHGETQWNAESRTQGSKNISLSERGKLQARLLAKSMSKYHIDHIYSSDLDRAFVTATIVADGLNVEIKKSDALREMSFGEWEGLTGKEIESQYKEYFTLWRDRPYEAFIPGGEMLLDVQKRALAVIYKLVAKHPNQNILVVSHGVTIKAILLGILDMDLSYFYKIRQDNTCINIVEFKNNKPILVRLNDTCHLDNISE